MRKIVSCEFNMDTACVELRLEDGTLFSIDCTAVENEVANSMYQRSELDWLIYNDPLAYAELILNGDPELYLRQHRTIAEASAVESPIRQETIGFPAHFFARAHNFKPPGRACQPEADSPMRT